jgi:hypothetical protein
MKYLDLERSNPKESRGGSYRTEKAIIKGLYR